MQHRSPKRLVGTLLLPCAILLSACKVHMDAEVSKAGTVQMAMTITDTDGMMAATGMTCDSLSTTMSSAGGDEKVVAEQISDNPLTCKITSQDQGTLDVETQADGTVIYGETGSSQPTNLSDEQLKQIDFSLTFHMPGEVVSATNDGKVEGNEVTYTDISNLYKGFSITVDPSISDDETVKGDDKETSKGDQTSKGTIATPDADEESISASDSSDSDNTTMWIFIGAGVLAFLGIAGIAFSVIRKKKDNPAPAQGYAQPYAQAPVAPNPPAAPAAPAVDQFGNPIQQFQQSPQQFPQAGDPRMGNPQAPQN